MGFRDYVRVYLGDRIVDTAYRGAFRVLGGEAVVPGMPSAAAWSVTAGENPGEVHVILSALPASGGAPVTDFVYGIDAGEALPLGAGPGLHLLTGLEPGATIQIRIAAVNAVGQGPWSAAKTVTVAHDAAPVAQSAPVIGGTAKVGATLFASAGEWSGNPAITLQWLRDGVAIVGATGATYVPAATDEGAMVAVRVTATNAGGSASATSPALGPVIAAGGGLAATGGDGQITITGFGAPSAPGATGGSGQIILIEYGA
ncbi:fibronectin type III domain-containing protein [Paenirhodobacter populi]|uniref:Fibronectin type III domain-containing protein n=1 Tax=Paenirhodobacter populi TaxID=2306993 RepID=A0A443IQ56_9RHOB|nr:fibronectin type III domain-containing protein [Sinirhodobacter populi]RWR08131.1 fibronectin type III domain-containing protein [Sinirhodobacter populi]